MATGAALKKPKYLCITFILLRISLLEQEEEEEATDDALIGLRSPKPSFNHEQFRELVFETEYNLVSNNEDGDTMRNNHDLFNISRLNENPLQPSTLGEGLDLVSLNMFSHEIKKLEDGDMLWKKIVKAEEDALGGEHGGMSKKSKELVERILENGKDEDKNLDKRLLEIAICEERLKLLKKKANDSEEMVKILKFSMLL
ncbi:hypothetical protein INT45_007988 [Circinella minor]|uniref:Uncharacterized protein n=1 Tax=Circinella minor TaxID=1195481 RepID=A0A8H7S5G7_9FUNG|nr:hypothetical protein INT45_007988 [Circinella minor]